MEVVARLYRSRSRRWLAGFVALIGLVRGASEPPSAGRPADTDPANFVEGPFTLAAGRSQIEWDVMTYRRNRDSDFREVSQSMSGVILRTALSAQCEFEVIHDGYGITRIEDLSTGERKSFEGLGNTTLQLKRNLIGNDGGGIALGVTAFALLNTRDPDVNVDETLMGGSVVLACYLVDGRAVSLSAHSQLKYEHTASTDLLEISQSLICTWDLNKKNRLAAEFNACWNSEARAKWALLSSLTFTHAFSDLLALDVAATAGLKRKAGGFGGFLVLTRWF